MNYPRRRCTWNIQVSPLTKITKLMPASYQFTFISACWARNETSWEVTSISLWTQTDFGGIFQIIQVYERYNGANKMQIKQHWVIPQTVPYSVQRNWKQQVLRRNNRTWKMAKWAGFRLNIDVRKEMEDSRLNAIECLKTDYVRKRSTEF